MGERSLNTVLVAENRHLRAQLADVERERDEARTLVRKLAGATSLDEHCNAVDEQEAAVKRWDRVDTDGGGDDK